MGKWCTRKTVGLAGVGLLVAVGLTFLATVRPTSSQQGPTVSIEDGQAPRAGTDVTRLWALGVSDPAVCGFVVDVEYDYDWSVQEPMGCDPDPEGNFDAGLCNQYYWSDTAAVRVVAGTGSPEGVTGDIPLADITWCAVGRPGESTDLHVEVVSLIGCEVTPAEIVPVAVQDGVNVIGTGTAPVGTDTDGDGFGDCPEIYLETDPSDNCPDASWHDAWPLDINMDKVVTMADVFKYAGRIGSTGGPPPSPNWLKRLDLNTDNFITMADIFMYSGHIGQGCT